VRSRSASIPHGAQGKNSVAAPLTFILISLLSYFISKGKGNRSGGSTKPEGNQTLI
jgi:hypothetical protein